MKLKLQFSHYKVSSLRESLINELILVKSRIGQLLRLRKAICEVIFSRQLLSTWIVLTVMLLVEMSKCWILEQIDVKTPTFDMKQSSSSLQLERFSYSLGVLMSLISWQIYWKFCFVRRKWLRLILFNFSNCLASLSKPVI